MCLTRISEKNPFFTVAFMKSTAILAFELNFFMDADVILVEHRYLHYVDVFKYRPYENCN